MISREVRVRGEWFGHPRGLTVLFLTQMWEQFSYFGMFSLLVLYMTNGLQMSQQSASVIFGAYTSAIYGAPIVGGFIADRLLGHRRAVLLGGVVMAGGHVMMMFPHLLFPALAALAVGTGLFLPSLVGQISRLYETSDPRRDAAYNVYYVGTNLGGVLAFVCGGLGATLGWHWGFGAAGLGMIVGLAIYLAGSSTLPPDKVEWGGAREAAAASGFGSRELMLVAQIVLIIVLFRIAYMQSGNTVLSWASTAVDRSALSGWEIPTPWFANLNPLIVLLLGPLLAWRWTSQARAGKRTSTMGKMALGSALVAGSYALAAALAWMAETTGVQPDWPWLALVYVILTIGELHIFPIGIALFGRLAPTGFGATMIAVWFFAGAGGNLLGGMFGTVWSSTGPPVFFALTSAIAATASILLMSRGRAVALAEANREGA